MKTFENENAKKYLYYTIIFLVICVLVIILAVWPKPEGGELFSADFKNGFDLYIEDSYALLINSDGWPFDSPHSIRRVADERLKSEILKLCKEIASYRELDRSKDIMLGAARLRYHPRIYLDTGSYCYRIEIFNWDNYSGKAWADYPVRQERFGEPVLHVKRTPRLSGRLQTTDNRSEKNSPPG